MLPKPTLSASIDALSDRDEFKVILGYLQDERERFFADLRQAENPHDVMKLAGSIATLDEIVSLLDRR